MSTKKLRIALSRFFPFINNETERVKWIKSELKDIDSGKRLLDAGAGECQYKIFCGHLSYVSQDFSEYDGSGNGVGLQTREWDTSKIDIVSDIIDMPVESNSFDAILCSEVIEHISYPDMAIKEFSRILRKGGVLLLTAPFASNTHFAPYHFCTGFNIYWYEKVLGDFGFKIEKVYRNGNYFYSLCQELIRAPITLNRYSKVSYFAYLIYMITIPTALIIFAFSKFTTRSEELQCFGYHIRAIKK